MERRMLINYSCIVLYLFMQTKRLLLATMERDVPPSEDFSIY